MHPPQSEKQNAKNLDFACQEGGKSFPPSAGGAVGNSRRHPGKTAWFWMTAAGLRAPLKGKGKQEDDSKDHQHFRGRAKPLRFHREPTLHTPQDPEVCFELISKDGHVAYEPFSFQQAIPPVYQEVFENGPASENHRLKRQLPEFVRMWDRNLQEQGLGDLWISSGSPGALLAAPRFV